MENCCLDHCAPAWTKTPTTTSTGKVLVIKNKNVKTGNPHCLCISRKRSFVNGCLFIFVLVPPSFFISLHSAVVIQTLSSHLLSPVHNIHFWNVVHLCPIFPLQLNLTLLPSVTPLLLSSSLYNTVFPRPVKLAGLAAPQN